MVAFTALSRAVHARPLGMIAAGFLLTGGILGVVRFHRFRLVERLGDLETEVQLLVLTSFFMAFDGAAVLVALARGGVADGPGGRNQGHGHGPGYGPGPGGYGYPQRPMGAPGPAAPGYGYPQGGGPGPPPPSSPPPGW